MPVFAVRLASIFCKNSHAAHYIHDQRYGLHVPRIDARSIAAKMVDVQIIGDGTDAVFIRNAMRVSIPAFSRNAQASISRLVLTAEPFPA